MRYFNMGNAGLNDKEGKRRFCREKFHNRIAFELFFPALAACEKHCLLERGFYRNIWKIALDIELAF